MALIHKKTFDVIQYYNREDVHKDDYFEVDDLIALTISLLNKKGYYTKFCCSGHPFIQLSEAFGNEKDGFKIIGGMKEILENTNPEYAYKYVGHYELDTNSMYISFAQPVIFDSIPSGFRLENDDCLSKKFSSQPASWECIEKIVENMKQLYLWAIELPSII
jgi:hypothetical protein